MSLIQSGTKVSNRKSLKRKPPTPWWDEKCAAIHKEKVDAFHEFKKRPNIDNINKYNEICKSVKKRLKKIKRDKYKESEVKIQSAKDTFHNVVHEKSSGNINNSFVKDNKKEKDITTHPSFEKNGESPGPDMISYAVISHFPEVMFEVLLAIFNAMFFSGNFPAKWKEYYMVFIPKAGSDKTRPISLANTIFKIMERLVKTRLEWWLEAHCILLPYQNGFRRGRSCALSILTLQTFIAEAFKEGCRVGVIFIDIKGAFDNVNSLKLLRIIRGEDLGIPDCYVKFIEFILFHKKVNGYFNGHYLGERIGSVGVPQGSVLSPLLFNLYMSRIHLNLEKDIHIISYADDVIFYKNKNIKEISFKLNWALKMLDINLARLNLDISTDKTKWILFDQKRRFNTNQNFIITHSLNITLSDNIIPLVRYCKYLGYIFDSKMNWSFHILSLRKSCIIRINLLKGFAGIKWGAHPLMLELVYKGLIRSVLDWGGIVLLDCPGKKINILNKIQYRCIRLVLGLMISTPTNILLDQMGEWPLKYRWKYLTSKIILKSLILGPNALIEVKKGNYWYDKNDYGNKKSQAGMDRLTEATIKSLDLDIEVYYTDGSIQSGGGAGFGVYSPCPEVREAIRVHDSLTISFVEGLALLRAVNLGLALLRAVNLVRDHAKKKVGIFTDSLSSLMMLNNMDLKGKCKKIYYDIKSAVHAAAKKDVDISFIWILSHRGIPGNHLADMLAGLGAISTETPLDELCYQNIDDVILRNKTSIRIEAIQELENEFLDKGSRYRSKIESVMQKPWFKDTWEVNRSVMGVYQLDTEHKTYPVQLSKVQLYQKESDHLLAKLSQIDCEFSADLIHNRAFDLKHIKTFKEKDNFLRSTYQSL
ncbi:uncharacterized protein LOC116846456 [Odontomachus brunneus]|uniref:uncharacterized protein LOC116846456 n=1 Tax=Odontomachus brunneus TaxID=486640 RepID=UPI0013F1B653|nr:uncharacterized protein LOC116846456 [Odontomachus brunneus]